MDVLIPGLQIFSNLKTSYFNTSNYLTILDKAYVAMKKVPQDVIQEQKKKYLKFLDNLNNSKNFM